jgi:hypothetical protein
LELQTYWSDQTTPFASGQSSAAQAAAKCWAAKVAASGKQESWMQGLGAKTCVKFSTPTLEHGSSFLFLLCLFSFLFLSWTGKNQDDSGAPAGLWLLSSTMELEPWKFCSAIHESEAARTRLWRGAIKIDTMVELETRLVDIQRSLGSCSGIVRLVRIWGR